MPIDPVLYWRFAGFADLKFTARALLLNRWDLYRWHVFVHFVQQTFIECLSMPEVKQGAG